MDEGTLRQELPGDWLIDSIDRAELRLRSNEESSAPTLETCGWRLRHVEDDLCLSDPARGRDAAGPRDLEIAPWSENQAAAAFSVYTQSFRARPGFPGWSESRWLAWATDYDAFRPEISCLVFIAGQPVGYAIAAVEASDVEAAQLETWIVQMGVVPGYRRSGIGRRLLKHVRSQAAAAGAEALWLSVNLNNPTARALYQGFGFEFRRRRAVYEAR